MSLCSREPCLQRPVRPCGCRTPSQSPQSRAFMNCSGVPWCGAHEEEGDPQLFFLRGWMAHVPISDAVQRGVFLPCPALPLPVCR